MPYYAQNGPTGAPPGSFRNPNSPWDFLPNTQNVLRGGFAKLPRVVPLGDPDDKYLAPHYPPKSNDFYELTSDGRLSEVYFENARIRRFRANPELSNLSAGLSPPHSIQSGVKTPPSPTPIMPNRIYIGQGNWRQAGEKESTVQERTENKQSYRHKHVQTPTQLGSRPWQQTRRREAQTDEELWKASERLDHEEDDVDDAEGWVQQQEEEDMRGDEVLFPDNTGDDEVGKFQIRRTIPRSTEGNKKEGQELEKNLGQLNLRQSPTKGNMVGLFERVLEQHTTRTAQDHAETGDQRPKSPRALYRTRDRPTKDQVVSSSIQEIDRDLETEAFPPYQTLHTNMPGDRSGGNSRLGRTRSDLESTVLPRPSDVVPSEGDEISLEGVDCSDVDYLNSLLRLE